MKKFLPLLCVLVFIFTACPIVKRDINKNGPARKKEKYAYRLEVINNSSSKIEYKYAPVLTQEGYSDIPCVKIFFDNDYSTKLKNLGHKGHIAYPVNAFNIFGTIGKNCKALLYTGIDCGTYHPWHAAISGHPNYNIDGLPARFVLMIDGDTRCYSLVYDCEAKNETSTVVITDETIMRLQSFKDSEFEKGYNGKREWYGASVKIEDRLYCFKRVEIKKSSLKDYSAIDGVDGNLVLYGRINLSYFFDYTKYPECLPNTEVIIHYDDDQDKFYYIKDDASVNPVD